MVAFGNHLGEFPCGRGESNESGSFATKPTTTRAWVNAAPAPKDAGGEDSRVFFREHSRRLLSPFLSLLQGGPAGWPRRARSARRREKKAGQGSVGTLYQRNGVARNLTGERGPAFYAGARAAGQGSAGVRPKRTGPVCVCGMTGGVRWAVRPKETGSREIRLSRGRLGVRN
jgi:hypothetical protein